MQRLIVLIFLTTFINIPFDVCVAECLEVDLHGKRITSSTLKEILEGSLPKGSYSGGIKINLSENYLEDDDVATVVAVLTERGLISHIVRLNLSNNRMGEKGVLALKDLLLASNVEYVDVSINSVERGAISSLSDALKGDADRIAASSGGDQIEILSDWLAKLIWLPHYDSFRDVPIHDKYKGAHQRYYGVT